MDGLYYFKSPTMNELTSSPFPLYVYSIYNKSVYNYIDFFNSSSTFSSSFFHKNRK